MMSGRWPRKVPPSLRSALIMSEHQRVGMKIHGLGISHSVSATGPGGPNCSAKCSSSHSPNLPLHHLVYRELCLVAKVAAVIPPQKPNNNLSRVFEAELLTPKRWSPLPARPLLSLCMYDVGEKTSHLSSAMLSRWATVPSWGPNNSSLHQIPVRHLKAETRPWHWRVWDPWSMRSCSWARYNTHTHTH